MRKFSWCQVRMLIKYRILDISLLFSDDVKKNNNNKLLTLRHPCTCQSSAFVFNFELKKCYEIIAFNEKYR